MPPPRPSNEVSRRNALEALQVMQDPPAAAFQDIALSAAAAFGVSGVYVSLIGDTQTWSQVGNSCRATPPIFYMSCCSETT